MNKKEMVDILDYQLKKRPKTPKKLCNTTIERLLGIISPSSLWKYGNDEDVKDYLKDTRRYLLYKRRLSKADYCRLKKDFEDYISKKEDK